MPRWKVPDINERRQHDPLSDDQILEAIELGLHDAILTCRDLGMKCEAHQSPPLTLDTDNLLKNDKKKRETEEHINLFTRHPDLLKKDIEELKLELDIETVEKYAGCEQLSTTAVADKNYFTIEVKDGVCKNVRKASLIHAFNDPDYISKDRSRRFIDTGGKLDKRCQTITQVGAERTLYRLDWFLIKGFGGIVRALEFKYLPGKTIPQQRVSLRYIDKDQDKIDEIGFLGEFWKIKENGFLESVAPPTQIQTAFIPLSNYVAHVPVPGKAQDNKNQRFLPQNVIYEVKKLINIESKRIFTLNLLTVKKKMNEKENDEDYEPPKYDKSTQKKEPEKIKIKKRKDLLKKKSND